MPTDNDGNYINTTDAGLAGYVGPDVDPAPGIAPHADSYARPLSLAPVLAVEEEVEEVEVPDPDDNEPHRTRTVRQPVSKRAR